MKLNIKYTDLKPSAAIETYVQKKMQSLDELVNVKEKSARGGATVEAWMEVGKTTHHHHKGMVFRAEAQIRMKGRYAVRAESVQPDLHLAIDEVQDELQRQLKDYKDKKKTKELQGARKLKKETGR